MNIFYTNLSNLHFTQDENLNKTVSNEFKINSEDKIFKKYSSNGSYGIRSSLIYLTESFDEYYLWDKFNINKVLYDQIKKIQSYTNVSNDNYEFIPKDILLDFGFDYLDFIRNCFMEVNSSIQSLNYNALEKFDRVKIILEKLSINGNGPYLLNKNNNSYKKYSEYIYNNGKYNFLRVNYTQDTNGLIISYNRSLSNIKSDDVIKEFIVSKFGSQNGKIIQVDYNAFHPRIIFSLCGYTFENNNDFYNDLIKELKINISRKDIKEILLKMFYGGHVFQGFKDKFKKVFDLRDNLENNYKKFRYVESPTGRRRFLESNEIKTKILNSYIQMMHSEIINEMLCKIDNFLSNKRTKLIGIISDSFLFDCHNSEKDILEDFIKNNLQKTDYLSKCFLKIKIKEGYSWAQCST